MKKVFGLMLCVILLAGCGARETFETVSDDLTVSGSVVGQVLVSLPEEAKASALIAEDGSKLYLCDGYTLTIHTIDGGKIDETLQLLTGFEKEDLTVMQTVRDGKDCYECVWTTAGEGEDQVCRTIVLDDGGYHYAVTAMAGYTDAGNLQDAWQKIMGSVEICTD